MKILLISIAAPPKSGAESLQVGRYLTYLSRENEITLVTTPAVQNGWVKEDVSQIEVLKRVDKVILKASINSWNRWKRAAARILLKSQSRKPDDDFLFHFFPKFLKKKLNTFPDLIYSRSSPFSSAILGLKMKKILGVPWCMHLSDPWTDSPYVSYKNKYSVQAEHACFKNADIISFTTPETLDFYTKKYPDFSNKFFLSPNVYSADDVNNSLKVFQNRKLVMLHSGNLYGKRNLESILAALSLLQKTEQDQIEFQLAGNMDQQNFEMLNASKLLCIKNLGFVTSDLSIDLQKKADILISIDKPLEVDIDKVFLPSKIQDYIAARKPILAITGTDSATYRTVHEKYGKCFDHRDINGLMNYIREAIKAYNNRDKNFFYMPMPPKEFDAQYNVNLLFSRFQRLVQSQTDSNDK